MNINANVIKGCFSILFKHQSVKTDRSDTQAIGLISTHSDTMFFPCNLKVILLAMCALALSYSIVFAADYSTNTEEPQKTGWPLTGEELQFVLKPEHERRPGSEKKQHLPALWPVTPSAGFWGGTSWLDTHSNLVNVVQANKGPIDVLLVGDSITMQWGKAWTQHFGQYKTVNIGIGGDKTQNVLWRLDHGGVEGLEPRLVVLLIGNNNMFFTSETGIEPVAQGIKMCVNNLRDKFPKASVIVVKVLPAHAPGNRFYEDIKRVNAALDTLNLESDSKVRLLDMWGDMVDADGTLKKELFSPDNIHLSQEGGYKLYAEKLKPLIEKALLGRPNAQVPGSARYILLNVQSPTRQVLDEILSAVPLPAQSELRIGFSFIVSYLAREDQATIAYLKNGLDLARESGMPVFIWLDGEYWWQHRPDLWNWWDPGKPGFDPKNRENVEWHSWNPDDALKISWLNWGRQIRMLPPPNLMSPRYRAACHEKMRLLVPIILEWWKGLPPEKKDLLAGIKVGWESSIGVNNFYYPGGNELLEKPADKDPKHGIKATEVPARGLVQLGYAAVKTAGIRTEGQITEADLAEVARRHMEDLARLAAELGVPRDRLFTHGAGWKEKELLYGTPVNMFSCPGWSFYRHAGDPSKDAGVQEALARSDAPYWGAVEWLYQGPQEVDAWCSALRKTLADPRCRLICIVNWSSIKDNAAAHEALRHVAGGKP